MKDDGPMGPWTLLQSYPLPSIEDIWERRFLGREMNFTRIKDMKPQEIYLHFHKPDEVPLFWGPIPHLDWNYDDKLGELRHNHKLGDWETKLVEVSSEPFMAETKAPYATLSLMGRQLVHDLGETEALRRGIFTWNARFVIHPLHHERKKEQG